MASMAGIAGISAGAAAAVGAGTAKELFDYNRENYMFDSEMRFQRFTAVRGFMNAQFSQYREDIRGMTELTAGKMDMNWTCGTLFMCVCAALSDAGRIGMHGAAPPGWLMALYSGHIFTCILYMSTAMWLALHASMRAQCGALSLLTRKVRLPIPSMAQLDAARNFGSGFERQKAGDVFRVPFMHHPHHAPELPEAGEEKKPAKGGKSSKGKDPGADFNSTGRSSVPSWVRDEQVVDKGLGAPSADVDVTVNDHELPEHFKLYAQAQTEWWPFEVYARIMLLYGVMQFLYAVAYYSLGTAISELRGFWISWSLPGMFIAAQVLILRLDTFQDVKGQTYLPHLEWAGHVAPYLAVIACTLEYRYTYDPAVVTVTWGFVLAAFFGHALFHLRLLDIAWPHFYMEQDPPETPGHAWWPSTWKLPPRFAKSLWIIAPPVKLEPGVSDLGNEAEALKMAGGGVVCRRRKGKEGKEGKTKASKSMPALKAQLDRIEGLFEEFFDPSLWPQVSKDGQAKVHELHLMFGRSRGSYDALGSTATPEQIGHVSVVFTEIETRLLRVDSLRQTLLTEGGAYVGRSPFARFTENRPPNLPWQIVRVAVLTVAFCWFFMMVATAVEIVLGPQSLMKPPGEPPWIRDQKYRHWTPSFVHYSNQGLPDDYRLYKAPEANYEPWSPESPTTRRLSPAAAENSTEQAVSGAMKELIGLLPKLDLLAGAVDKYQPFILAPGEAMAAATTENTAPGVAFLPASVKALPVTWPAMFEPQHLVCAVDDQGQEVVAALTGRGLGAKVPLPASSEQQLSEAQPLYLAGVDDSLAGVAWTTRGLEVMTKTGKVLSCPGSFGREASVWSCVEDPVATFTLPRTSRLASAALSELAGGKRMAAVQFEESPGRVAVFARGTARSSEWRPAGELHVLPPGSPRSLASRRMGLSFQGEDLLVTLQNGEVHRHRLGEGASLLFSGRPTQREWRSACAVADGKVLRLALQQSTTEAGAAWLPELILPH